MPLRRLTALAAASTLLIGSAIAALPAGASTADGPVQVVATMAVPAQATTGFTYAPDQVPVGSRVRVHSVATGGGKTLVTLHVRGLLPNESYGAHAHYRPCGATGLSAGAHYQDLADPAVNGSETAASMDPAYANPANEIWLDLETNAAGNGRAQSVVDWTFRPATARSIILHVNPTNPANGTAGARLGCVTVGF